MSTHTDLGDLRSAGWIFIAAGAISIVAGLLAIAYPDITLLALAIFGGINLMVLGVLSLIDAFSDDQDSGGRTLSAILGVLGIIAGIIVLRRPGETLVALVLVFGIWLVVEGIIHGVRALGRGEGRLVSLLLAGCEVALGVLILSLPDLSLKTVAVLAGIGFIARGLLAVWGGLQLRRAAAAASADAGQLAPAA